MTNLSRSAVSEIGETVRAFAIRANKHIGGGTSSAEIMASLYFGPTSVAQADGDNFILSKGHSPSSQYFCLWLLGRFGDTDLNDLVAFGSQTSAIPRMPRRDPKKGILFGSGALGQGLSFANGLAAADRKLQRNRDTYVLLGDAECTEGQIWEAADTSANFNLQNLTVVVDVNGFGSGITVGRDQWAAKWRSFGFDVKEVDGHNTEEICAAIEWAKGERPTCIIAHTIKGYGLSALVAGTNTVHQEYPGAEMLRPDLEIRTSSAQTAVRNSNAFQGPLNEAAPDRRSIERMAAKFRSFDFGGVETYHTKKFMKSLGTLVDNAEPILFVTPDALSNSALNGLSQVFGRWSWKNASSPVAECFISEQDSVSFAAGVSAGGVKAVVMLMEGFVWRALDSIRESVCFQNLPVTIVATSGGLGDGLGPMVQSDSCLHAVSGMVNLSVFEACDVETAVELFADSLEAAIPTYLRLPHEERPTAKSMKISNRSVPNIGSLRVYAPLNKPDIHIVTSGSVLPNVLAAQELLLDSDIQANVIEVLSVTQLRALGMRAVAEIIDRSIPILSVHNAPTYVLGQFVGDEGTSLGVDDFGHFGKPVEGLYARYGLNVSGIVGAAKKLILDRSALTLH